MNYETVIRDIDSLFEDLVNIDHFILGMKVATHTDVSRLENTVSRAKNKLRWVREYIKKSESEE